MRFGFFDQLPCADADSERQRYQDLLAQIELGDALGFDTVWLGELHFSRAFSILADPLMVLAAAAQRTTRIRLGTAVTLFAPAQPGEDRRRSGHRRHPQQWPSGVRGGARDGPGPLRGIRDTPGREPGTLRGGARLHRPGVDAKALLVPRKILSGARPDGGSETRANTPSSGADRRE